jgi:hypothetical protein
MDEDTGGGSSLEKSQENFSPTGGLDKFRLWWPYPVVNSFYRSLLLATVSSVVVQAAPEPTLKAGSEVLLTPLAEAKWIQGEPLKAFEPDKVYIFECWANFITLDTEERSVFAGAPQNHLIYQVQKSLPSGTKVQNLVFNHPIKFITTGYTNNCLIGTSAATAAGNPTDFVDTMLFQVNGVDIGEQKAYSPHFDLVPSYYVCPVTTPSTNAFLLPFCLETTKLQPTGTLNFSRIDSARLVSSNNFVNTLYAVNYNILKIENGMGGLLYAN